MEIRWRLISGEGESWGGQVQVIRSIIGRHEIDGEVKNRLRIV